ETDHEVTLVAAQPLDEIHPDRFVRGEVERAAQRHLDDGRAVPDLDDEVAHDSALPQDNRREPSLRRARAAAPYARAMARIEFEQRFALDHLAMDDEFWSRLRAAFADDEIADLTICCAAWLGMGRAMAVIGVAAPEERLLV